MKRRTSTGPAGGYFVACGARRGESQAGLEACGVPEDQQLYGGLPDGRLTAYVADVSRDLVRAALDYNVGTMVAPDAYGIDGHDDHRTMFVAACMAIGTLAAEHGRTVGLDVLDSRGRGSLVLPGNEITRPQKLWAMGRNASQMLVRHESEVAITEAETGLVLDHDIGDEYRTTEEFWDKMEPYHGHIERETYRAVTADSAALHVAAALSGRTGLELAWAA